MTRAASLSIQINEDDDSVRRTLTARLTRLGYACTEAKDGSEGLKLFLSHRPDVVITDLVMKPVDGLEFLRRLREIDAVTPVIVLSAHETPEILRDAMRAGACDFLVKPFNTAELDASLARALSRMLRPSESPGSFDSDAPEGRPSMPYLSARSTFFPSSAPPEGLDEQQTMAFGDAKKAFEESYFQMLLERMEGNVARVSRAAGMDPANVRRVLKRHGLRPDDYRSSHA